MEHKVEPDRNRALEGGEEMLPLYGQRPVLVAPHSVFLFFGDGAAEDGIPAGHLFFGDVFEVMGGVRNDAVLPLQGLFAGKDAGEVLGVEGPAEHFVLEGVDLYGVGYGVALEIGVGIARDDVLEGSEGEDGEERSEENQEPYRRPQEGLQLAESEDADPFVGGVLAEGEPVEL